MVVVTVMPNVPLVTIHPQLLYWRFMDENLMMSTSGPNQYLHNRGMKRDTVFRVVRTLRIFFKIATACLLKLP